MPGHGNPPGPGLENESGSGECRGITRQSGTPSSRDGTAVTRRRENRGSNASGERSHRPGRLPGDPHPGQPAVHALRALHGLEVRAEPVRVRSVDRRRQAGACPPGRRHPNSRTRFVGTDHPTMNPPQNPTRPRRPHYHAWMGRGPQPLRLTEYYPTQTAAREVLRQLRDELTRTCRYHKGRCYRGNIPSLRLDFTQGHAFDWVELRSCGLECEPQDRPPEQGTAKWPPPRRKRIRRKRGEQPAIPSTDPLKRGHPKSAHSKRASICGK